MKIHYCQCYPAPLQLLQRGLFPCTPTAPTLAVDLKMLEFTCKLFLRVAPNNTAWCDALESFLGGCKYKLTTRVSYRSDHILLVLMRGLIRIHYSDTLATHYYGTIALLTTPTNTSKIYWIHIDQIEGRVCGLHLRLTAYRIFQFTDLCNL